MNVNYCLWCPLKDINATTTGSCVHVSDVKKSICMKNDFAKSNASCPSFLVEPAPAIVSTPVYIALAGGLFGLVALAAIIAFFLKTSKSDSEILLKGEDPFLSGAVVENPIHEPSTNVTLNPIFDSAGGGDTDL